MSVKNPRFIDQTWIDLFDPISVALWTSRLKVKESDLRSLVRTLGGNARKVEQYVHRHKMFPESSEN